jgi:hypothetical protein
VSELVPYSLKYYSVYKGEDTNKNEMWDVERVTCERTSSWAWGSVYYRRVKEENKNNVREHNW